jgi:hypothetical protein
MIINSQGTGLELNGECTGVGMERGADTVEGIDTGI